MKFLFIVYFLLPVIVLSNVRATAQASIAPIGQNEEDSIVWKAATHFNGIFDSGDTAAMNQLLDDDFILQWMHENFLGKKSLLKAMTDTAVHASLQHKLLLDASTIIRYSDNHKVACVNAVFEFVDPATAELIKKKNGFGLCIMNFRKINELWRLKVVHLDLHCSLCSF